ncbi:A/G-specific adenine glycosylase [Flavobacteriales bacterium]|nr:A/G-specific adenine glycosylase [Flavobacteriales bacterium]
MDFSTKLVNWYQVNKRDLPWRNTVNVYHIWLSEIILQQTRVVQGMPYYLAFIKEFPDIEDLANASEDRVLKMWQGLGYYSRARNLHFTAKDIVKNYSGKFPNDYNKILRLKGIGIYTAAAISSFAFDLPYAVVDGNVIRVLSRVFGIDTPFDTALGKKEFKRLANKCLIKEDSAIYNQSIMEFGALQCVPKSPDCSICLMQDICEAYSTNMVKELPLRLRKNIVRNRFLHFLMIKDKGNIYIKKREKGIWVGLYELPFLEFKHRLSEEEVLNSDEWLNLFKANKLDVCLVSDEFVHVLSHQKIYARFWQLRTQDISLTEYELISMKNLSDYPVSRLTEKYFESIKLI